MAKQAAAVDVLSDGRLRLGVAVGWNVVEYEALGEDFHITKPDQHIEMLRRFKEVARVQAGPSRRPRIARGAETTGEDRSKGSRST